MEGVEKIICFRTTGNGRALSARELVHTTRESAKARFRAFARAHARNVWLRGRLRCRQRVTATLEKPPWPPAPLLLASHAGPPPSLSR